MRAFLGAVQLIDEDGFFLTNTEGGRESLKYGLGAFPTH